ncbi:MAG: DUF3800 domain-containing protein [Phycisphaerales bacterium]|nr:DUF3800 domain-containing protein [Phycisphaerales bacterium]
MDSHSSSNPSRSGSPLYVFFDEGGNLDFSATGTRYFTLTGVWLHRPFPCDLELINLRFDLIETGLNIEYFHAAEDRQAVRNRVFEILSGRLDRFRADSVVVEKRMTAPPLRSDERFYPETLGYLLRHILECCELADWSEVIVITDTIPVNRKRRAIEGSVKTTLARMLPAGMPYRVLHHSSKSCIGLQIADYFNWAIFRSWERGDGRSLDAVRPAVRSQFDIFRKGTTIWYDRPTK